MRFRVLILAQLAACGTVGAAASDASPPALAAPVKIVADGKPIAVDIGHAAPFVVDFNKDGLKDLVVGQFKDGKARVYLNTGTDADPKFGKFTYLKAAGADASVPAV